MSKLKLIAKAILADVKNPDIPDEKKIETIEEGMKVYAVECLNLQQFLRDKDVPFETAAGIIETLGITWDGRAKKFK